MAIDEQRIKELWESGCETDAKELIDHLYELVKEAGILITDEEIEQENN